MDSSVPLSHTNSRACVPSWPAHGVETYYKPLCMAACVQKSGREIDAVHQQRESALHIKVRPMSYPPRFVTALLGTLERKPLHDCHLYNITYRFGARGGIFLNGSFLSQTSVRLFERLAKMHRRVLNLMWEQFQPTLRAHVFIYIFKAYVEALKFSLLCVFFHLWLIATLLFLW